MKLLIVNKNKWKKKQNKRQQLKGISGFEIELLLNIHMEIYGNSMGLQ